MEPKFVHLHLHSEYSLVDGILRIKPLVKAVAAGGMPAVALTDQCNLFGMVKFYQAAEAAGIKPLVGVDAWLHNPADTPQPHRLLLLAKDLTGYRNLTRLVSRSYREGQQLGSPQMRKEWLAEASAGLIVLSGGRDGDLGRTLLGGHPEQADTLLDTWLGLFGDRFYLELTRTGREQEEDYLERAVELATRRGVPVVATNDVRFQSAADFDAHEVRVCIHDGRTLDDPRRPRRYSDQQYLRSAQEMAELFADLPEALDNAVEIARRCTLQLTLGKSYLPQFPTPPGLSLGDLLTQQSERGLAERLAALPDGSAPPGDYRQRLAVELKVIIDMGFAGYFLIVADFIQWAREHDIPVGPGRGSGAGSLVAYALKITDLDPLAHGLLFERFLNPERVSMPDFDVDFCMDKRDRVIEYVAQRYGRDAVSQIITHGSMAAKAVVRDVGRVLGHPYGFVDRIAKLIPFELDMTLDKALANSEDFKKVYDGEEEVAALIDMARALEGLARNAGKHAGGVVIAPGQLTDFTPLYCEPSGEGLVSQFDMKDVEQVGLVKFDFLGLRTLTIIDWALKTLNRARAARGEPPVDIAKIPMEDEPSYALLKRCETTAVFQLESRGMKELIRKLQPDCFGDMTALVALFRPGPLQSGMVDDFINRKHGRQQVEYPHPALAPILEPTYGVILYQEQVMQIAQVLAGYSLGSADLLRRAMGKKNPEAMAKQRSVFVEGSVARGVDQAVASHIFDLMEKFAGYGFNKSHSAAYALVAYQTLWLKAHYPAAFMAAVLSSDMDNTDKVVTFIDEARSMKLQVEPPDLNRSEYKFTVDGERTLIYGLGAIKGVGEAAIEALLDARARGGCFADLFDLCKRIDSRRANRRVLEALIRAGALDRLGPNRATLMMQLPLALKLAEQHQETQTVGQGDLFGMHEPAAAGPLDRQLWPQASQEWEDEQRLQGEKETLGLYLTGHPIDRYQDELKSLVSGRIASLLEDPGPANTGFGRNRGRKVTVAGLVVDARHRNTPRGRMGSVTLDDCSGRLEVAVFADQYEALRDLLSLDKILVVSGSLAPDEFRGGMSLRAERVMELEQARALSADHLLLRAIPARMVNAAGWIDRLEEILTLHRGGRCALLVDFQGSGATGRFKLGDAWRVQPRDLLLKSLAELLGPGTVRVVHTRGALAEESSDGGQRLARDGG